MKKVMSFLLATGLSVSGLVGCSNEVAESEGTPSETPQQVEDATSDGEKTVVKLSLFNHMTVWLILFNHKFYYH